MRLPHFLHFGMEAAAPPAKPGDVASCLRVQALASAERDIDPALLHDTQAYLLGRIERRHLDRHLIQSWERFYRIYDPLIRRFALQCGALPADSADCVQQVWVELVRRLHGFRHDSERCRFRSWLYRIVRSQAINLHRYQTSHPAENLLVHQEAELRGRDADPESCCERHGQQDVVRRVLAELRQRVSERSYRVLYLRWMEGWTVREVGACLGLTPQQVWLREHRIKRKFRCLWDRHTSNTRRLLP
jgi:RNA polymerase sigma factor (sigma-70 family)